MTGAGFNRCQSRAVDYLFQPYPAQEGTTMNGRYGNQGLSRLMVSGVLISLWGSLLASPGRAQPAITTAQLTAIVGTDALIQGQVARVNDTAQDGQQIRTTQARSQLLLNTGSITRLGPGSAYTVGANCIDVTAGKLLVNGPSQVCYGNGVVAVQGTTYLIQIFSSGIAQLSVLEGSLGISNPQNAAIPPLTILPGEVVEIDREGREGSRRDLSAAQYGVLLQDELMTLFGDLPNMTPFRRTFTRLYPGDPVPSPIQIPADRNAGPLSRGQDSDDHSSSCCDDDDDSYSPPEPAI